MQSIYSCRLPSAVVLVLFLASIRAGAADIHVPGNCPTINLADQAVLLEGDRPVRIVAVKARGHETRAVPPGDSSEPIA